MKKLKEIADRITEYLCCGGLFNPELMEHDKVRQLLMDARAAINSLEVDLAKDEIMKEIKQEVAKDSDSDPNSGYEALREFGFERHNMKAYEFTDPDGDTLSLDANYSFGDRSITLFIDSGDGASCEGIRMTLGEAKRLAQELYKLIEE